MFTFSFGSAFAVTAGPAKDTYAVANVSSVYTAVADAQAKVEAAIEKAEADALYAIFTGKPSVKLGSGNMTVTYDQVKKYYDSEVVAKAKAQASKEASAIYAKIQEALNVTTTEYIAIVTNAGDAGQWDDTKGYNVYVGFTGTVDGYDVVDSTNFTAVFDGSALTGTKSKEIAKDAFAELVTAKLAAIAAIDPEAYIADDQEAVKDLKAAAAKQVNALGNNVAAGDYAFTTVAQAGYNVSLTQDMTTVNNEFIGRLNDVYVPAVNEAAASGKLAVELAKLTLSADEPTVAAKLAWAKAQIMDKFEEAIETEYDNAVAAANQTLLNESLKGAKANQKNIDEANATIEAAKKQQAAALEIAAYLVEDCEKLSDMITEHPTNFAASTVLFGVGQNWNYASAYIKAPQITTADKSYTNLVAVAGYVDAVEADAAALKADIAIDGTTAVEIDALLEDAIEATYKTGARQYLPENTMNAALEQRMHELTGVNCYGADTAADTVKIGLKTYTTVNAWDETAYEDARLDEVKAIKKATKAAINAAADKAAAEEAFLAGLEEYKAVLTKSDAAVNRATKAYKDLETKYEAQLNAEVDYVVAGIAAAKATNVPFADDTTYVANLVADLDKAYTVEELTENYEKLSAEVKALKDKATLDAEKKELEERCKAYSAVVVTAADKAEIVALRNDVAAFRSYVARIGASQTVADYGLNSKVATIIAGEVKAIEDAYKAINKDSKAKLDEAEAVAALRAALTAYNTEWDAFIEDLETGHGVVKTVPTTTNLALFEQQIFAAQVDAVEAQIGAIAAKDADAATVVAARAAYDALTLCQKNDVADRYYDKLVDLEKLVAAELVGNVEGLKITASSSAKKGAITVKWTTKGSTVGVEAYEIWKSTKKNSGFKKAFTTEKMSYKNTKGLKKGTRYYYKVRAIATIDGEKITSDWSNKAYRIAK